ncbi:centrosomal protein kizuna [Lacerta agilis]|uniref:centrosomal protein kizuna n=1 Tax=Lacerta agilis TaxID=80427 RepID=UPI001419A53F|nr:centrosomal protein kizuna [Lacerta agilis]
MAGSVRGAPSPPAAACGDNGYGGQVRRLRENLWDSETKRLELERKMLEYTICDTRTTKMKYRKLKKYLEEICERQKKSLLRNQDLLKEFDCIEAQIQKFASRSECLQRLKTEYEGRFKGEQIPDRKNISKSSKSDVMKHQMVPEVRQTGINSRTAMSRGLYHTATIFMGRQMSAVSSVEDFSVPPKSSELTKSFSISDPHSHRQPSQSSYVTDSCVVRSNSDLQRSNKSDKIDGKTYLLMGKETPVTSSVSYENERTCCLTVESKTNNCSSNFVESKMSPELNSLLHGRLSPENRTTDLKSDSSCKSLEEILTHEYSVRNEQGSKRPILLVCRPEQLVSGNEHSRAKFPVPEDSLMLDKNAQEKEGESSGGSSDLTVSFSEEDEEGKPLKLQELGCSTPYNEEELPCSQALCHYSSSGGSSASLTIRKSLTFEGFAHVLTFIEQFVATADQEHRMLYQRKAVNTVELETLIRFKYYFLLTGRHTEHDEDAFKVPPPLKGIHVFLPCACSVSQLCPSLFGYSHRSTDVNVFPNPFKITFYRDENQRGMVSTIKSKAFWGDSDDSNSEIEEALRPQVHSSQKDEFDDFYD